ncbi:MAG: protease inhibitor I9 family protein [Cytophagaceae bacterium]|nr:protease inhibitor I9 family protein [Cytophagaceae bacterium]
MVLKLRICLANGANPAAIEHVYSTALTGFSAFLSPAEAQKLLASGAVDYIEQDTEVYISQKGKPGVHYPTAGNPWITDSMEQVMSAKPRIIDWYRPVTS